MKKRLTILLSFILAVGMLAGCGPKEAEVDTGTFSVTVTNASGYIFNELYVSATAANSWGSDHLGSTSVLKNNGSFNITLTKYDFDNFDIKVVDEDGDTYVFSRVPLAAGTEVAISFSDGLIATVTGADGSSTTVPGTLSSGSGDSGDSGDAAGQSDPGDTVDMSGEFTFTIYNESDYDVYAIYMMPAYTDGDGVDILPSILAAGESYTFTASVAGTDYEGIEDWTLRIVDVDNDESAFYEVFNPWLLSYVDISWDSANSGYICEFVYD